jgi:hypothetical protein
MTADQQERTIYCDAKLGPGFCFGDLGFYSDESLKGWVMTERSGSEPSENIVEEVEVFQVVIPARRSCSVA